LAIALVLAAGCSSSSKTATTSSTTAGNTTATTGGASAASLVPAAVKSKGTLVVAMDASYAPDEFIGTDGHTIMGMDADLANALGKDLGLTVSLQNATFDTIIPALASGKFDLGASSFTDTKAREGQVDFVDYGSFGEGFYVGASSTTTFNGLDSLCGHKVSVESGTTEETDANTQIKTCQSESKPVDTVLSFADQNAANLAVSSGRAELGFSDSQVAAYIVQQSNGQFKLTGTPFSTAPYGLAMPKNGLAPAVLAALKDLMANGMYLQIFTKWNVQAGAITKPVINGATS
jgi:polar amino acid transport system substrate-binding protein